ncbi:CPBP family intramembrane glutamic endopeptidase [Fructilactobacillus carniphilus]|uniref:CPBP family intramembrane metalloprotease n=1 Tax=Fructilactobacillus carniphilus TaxID=2940297 RepID=A0ABY5BY17_9LACO|nr:CPBP family intramembrane glutamic endopeptidase [Fructilactobacillus carniphilus]USS90689.1 CPBP family intramembrane metalloprotease [Fructilactobacillus carniphilus]
MKKLFVCLAFPFLVGLIQIPTLGELLWGNETSHHFNYWAHLGVSGGSFLVLGLVLLLIYKGLGGTSIDWSWKIIGIAVVAAVLSQTIQFGLSIITKTPTSDPETLMALHSGIGSVTVLTLLVFSPILEELLFQGILQQRILGKLNPYLAVVITAIIFAVIHGYAFGIGTLELLFSGLAYALAFNYAEDLKCPMLAHGLSNLIVMLLLLWSA